MTCFDSQNLLSFKIIEQTNSTFDFKINISLHAKCKKCNLNHELIKTQLTKYNVK